MIGRTLDGRWVIEEKIGEGGMGAVYKGSQRSVNRTIAIKTLRANLTDNDEFVDRFFREAKIATTINHPHCVTVLDFGQDPETQELYLAMEFLDGMPLADKMDEGSLSMVELLKISIQVASALAASHANSIIHRDLKPDNIFLVDMATGDVFAKVLDFGIAKVSDDSNQYTRTGQIFGTPDYMSPEQCSGQTLDGRSDLYSLGCIMYEITTGHTPFAADNPMAILMAHMTETAPSPSALGIELPPGLEAIIMRLLSKEATDRFEHANALIMALKEVQERLAGVHAYHKSQGVRVPTFMTSPAGGFERVQTPISGVQAPVPAQRPATSSMDAGLAQEEWEPAPSKKPLLMLGALVLMGIIAASIAVSVLTMDTAPEDDAPVATTAPAISTSEEPRAQVTEKAPKIVPKSDDVTTEPDVEDGDPVAVGTSTNTTVKTKKRPRRTKVTTSAPPVAKVKPAIKDEPVAKTEPVVIAPTPSVTSDHDAVQAALDGMREAKKNKPVPKPPKPKPKPKQKSYGIVDDLGL